MVLTLLEREDLIRKKVRGPVTDVDWRGLINRWTEDYSLSEATAPDLTWNHEEQAPYSANSETRISGMP